MRQKQPRHSSTGRILLIVIVAVGLLVSACGDADEPDPTRSAGGPVDTIAPTEQEPSVTPTEAEVIGGDQERIDPPELDDPEVQDFIAGLNSFAFDFYQFVAAQGNDNLIYSPASIELAFSMVYAGARGETEVQMADVLGYLPQADQHPAANALDAHLTSLGTGDPVPGQEEGEPFKLTLANAIWGQDGYPFLDSFLETLAAHYGAEMRIVDFVQDAEAARQLVNAWVAERTEDRIQDAVPPGVLTDATRLVLANAIYFKAGWLFPFQESATVDGLFTLLDGNTVTVPLMHTSDARVSYSEGDGYQAAALPFAGEGVEMLVILPEEGRFEEVTESLDASFLDSLRASTETRDIVLTMPRFDFKSQFDLVAILPEMGMPAPFGPADFSGIAEPSDLYISAALHHATITVDEKGVEATAATIIAMDESAMERADLTLNRPFVFAIVDSETGAILFLGRVLNPAG